MRSRLFPLFLVFILFAAACSSADNNASPTGDTSEEATDAGASGATAAMVRVGAGSRSILPLVDGAQDYLDQLPTPDPTSPGVFIPEWDNGEVAVGNGADSSRWVHDDVQISALAIEDDDVIVVIVSFDFYMFFRPDGTQLREMVEAALPAELKGRVEIVFGSTHNHEGPDPAFEINHEWFEFMLERSTEAIVESVDTLEDGALSYGKTEHWFGVAARRDPRIIDPSLHTLQATNSNGDVVGTVVGWSSHPETMLRYEPTVSETDCAALLEIDGPSDEDEDAECSAHERLYSSDFVGPMRDDIKAEYGGEVLYLNGSIGAMLTTLKAPVWEVSDEYPIGDGYTVPEGAPAPFDDAGYEDEEYEDGDEYLEGNFRRMEIIGEQLAIAAISSIEAGEVLEEADLTWTEQDIFTPLTHTGFRILGTVDPETGYSELGHNPAELFTCTEPEKTVETCDSDNFESLEDPLIGESVRVGDHIRSAVGYLKIGPIGMMFIPGEIQSQLTIGLPAGFDDAPEQWYKHPESHAVGTELEIPGYIYDMMPDENQWVVGLGNDQLGYIVPPSDWLLSCVADEISEEGTCADLFDRGGIKTVDGVAGDVCVALQNEGEDYLEVILPPGEFDDTDRNFVQLSCTYGQVLGREVSHPEHHYEETNSAGWDLPADILETVAELTGGDLGGRINENFAGSWQELPEPAE